MADTRSTIAPPRRRTAAVAGGSADGARLAPPVDAAAPVVSVGAVVARFAAAGLVALLILALVTVLFSQRAGLAEAIDDARNLSAVLARHLVEPALQDGLVRREQAAIAALDEVVRESVLQGSLVRVKLWSGDGRILYSDEPRYMTETYALGDDEQEALEGRAPEAELSDLSKPENEFEDPHTSLLEVYQPVRTPSGEPLLFETYFRYEGLTEAGRRIWWTFAPAALGALVLLELVQIPFAWSMARRLRRGQEDRERLLRHAISASDRERRRIAADLHDGVVQDLAGVSLELSAASRRNATAVEARVMDTAATDVRQSLKSLRSLLADIYPPNLADEGLDAALSDLLARVAEHGADTHLQVSLDTPPPAELAALLYRAAQEALRNVSSHAAANEVIVTVTDVDGCLVLTVEDDGAGFDPRPVDTSGDSHLGLRVMADLVTDAGGTVEVESAPGAGTRVCVKVPR